jgi:hypothetical protein
VRAAVIAGLLALLPAAVSAAPPSEVAPCLVLPPVEDVAPGDIPPLLRNALAHDIGAFALPGADYDATDVVRTGVNRRLLWVRRRGTRWVVAFEHGGRIYNDPFFAYELGLDGQTIAGVRGGIAFPASVCQVTERELWR